MQARTKQTTAMIKERHKYGEKEDNDKKYINKEGVYGTQKKKKRKIPSPLFFFDILIIFFYFNKASVTTSAFIVLRSGYFCPVPTKTIGLSVV